MFKRYWWMFFVMIPLGSLAGLLAAAVITYLIPKQYESETVIEIKPRQAGMSPLGADMTETSGASRMTPQFFGTEFEKIKSRNSLSKVVDNLQLVNRWNVDKEGALGILKGIVNTQNIRGTDLVSIRVRHTNKVDARDIAEGVARAYKEYRAEIESHDAERQLHELNKAVRDQEDKVEERRKVLSTIVRTKGIIYRGQDAFYNQSGVDDDEGARRSMQTYHEIEQEKLQLESQISSLLKYDNDQLMVYAGGLNLPDNIIRTLYPQYQEATRALEDMKTKNLGEDHPSMREKVAQIELMRRQLDESVVNLRATLQAQLDLASNRLKSMEAMKNDTREEAIKRGLDAQDYVDAKRDFETDQQLLQTMKLKLMGETISRKIPGESVEVHDPPVISNSPISPNVTLNLLIGTGLGFLLSPLMALPLMWLMNRCRPAQPAA